MVSSVAYDSVINVAAWSFNERNKLLPSNFRYFLGEQYLLLLSVPFFLIGVHTMQDWTATTRHGVTKKEAQKRLQDTENLFKKNLQLKDVC